MENQELTSNQTSSNIIHYIGYSLLILISLGLAYLNFMPKKVAVEPAKTAEKTVGFTDLPYSIQQEYKSLDEFKKIELKLNDAVLEKQTLLKEVSSLQEEKVTLQTEMENAKAVGKQTITAPLNMSIDANTEIQSSAKRIKAFAKCYDMDVGKYSISTQCRKDIISFVDKHKNAKYFEIIGIIDETEFTLFKNLENNNFIYDKLRVTQHSIDTMKKLSQSGLAKHRAIEANWVIKSHTQKKAQVFNANYNLLSNDGKKGFVIRAYE